MSTYVSTYKFDGYFIDKCKKKALSTYCVYNPPPHCFCKYVIYGGYHRRKSIQLFSLQTRNSIRGFVHPSVDRDLDDLDDLE